MQSESKPSSSTGKRIPKITALTVPELKLIVGAGPGGRSAGPGRESCVCVCG